MSILSLSACNNNDTPDAPDDPVKSFISYDGEEEMLSNFFTTDDDGNVQDYIIGVPIDADHMDVTTCALGDLDKAREMFLTLIPDDGKVERNSDGSIVYTPVQIETYYKWSGDSIDEPKEERIVATDQPSVTFTPVEQGNLLATVTFASPTSPIKRLEILYNWPLNSFSEYQEGEEVTRSPIIGNKDVKFLCIREASDGIAGVLLFISPETREIRSPFYEQAEYNREGKIIDPDNKKMPSLGQMNEYWKILSSDMNRWQRKFVSAGMGKPEYGTTYWFGGKHFFSWDGFRYKQGGSYQKEGYSRLKHWKFQYFQHETFNFAPPKK